MAALFAILCAFLCVTPSVCQLDKKGYFWQLNDLHYDPTYWSIQASCNEPVEEPGKYGDYRCDSPWSLVESAVKAIQNHGREAEFIMWSGDLPAHFKKESANVTEALLLEITRNITDLLTDAFPDIPILPVIGNHDYFPKNELPGQKTALYETLGNMWESLFNDTEITEKFKEGGFYSKLVSESPPVRAVVPNSNLYYPANPLELGEDPGGQYAWLEDTLNKAQQQGEKIYVFTHISPGVMEVARNENFYAPQHNARFLQILQTYGDIIMGTFAGHSHMDSFKIVYRDGEPVTSVFVAPSVTPWQARLPDNKHGIAHNPAVRKVSFWSANYSLEDIEQYYLDLPRANDGQMEEWTRLHSFKNLYQIHNMTPDSLQTLLEEFKEFGNEKFHVYYERNSVQVSAEQRPPCGCSCKSDHICAIEFVDLDGYDKCIADPGYTCSGSNHAGSVVLMLVLLLLSVWAGY